MQGKETKTIEEAGAGDIVALAKLKETGTGDTLSDPAHPVRFAALRVPAAGHLLRHHARRTGRRGEGLATGSGVWARKTRPWSCASTRRPRR